MTRSRPTTFGWVRDLPDPRDYSSEHPVVSALYRDIDPVAPGRLKQVDWSEYFLPAGDQLSLDACSAHACVGLAEYFERRSSGSARASSRLFLHQMARRLARPGGASEASLRTTLKAIGRFGLPPEALWPYDPGRVSDEPEPLLYSYAREFQSLVYVRLDPSGATGESVLRAVKGHLAAGLPCAFGFTAFNTLSREPDIPAPTQFDTVQGGGAAVAVGFDDTRRILSAKGALRVRAPWGEDWGEEGYGWLPYAYIEDRLAADFWTILRPDWLASGEFRRPPKT
jgi:C1A family cysteine protease